MSRWPQLSSSHIGFFKYHSSVLSYHLPETTGYFPLDSSTVALICQAEK